METERWTAFRSHWGVEAFYCRPGEVGAHEKGGDVVPVPRSTRWPNSTS
ncbi:hypothetical protein ACQPW3_11435 [Actinosynnema sp. CA-248983]